MQYNPLNQVESGDDDCRQCGEKTAHLPPARRSSRWATLAKYSALGMCFMLSFGLGSLSSAFHPWRAGHDGIDIPWASDLTDALSKKPIQFRGAFNFTSKYRGPPSPEIDEAWARYDFNPMLRVSAKDIETAVRGQEGYLDTAIAIEGGGYLGTIEMFHQLHCVNMVRMATYHDYYKNKGHYGNQTHEVWRTHIDHCIEIIRQIVACNSDTGLIAFHWVEGNPNPYPDLSTWHKCRDEEAVREWAMDKEAKNGIDRNKGLVKKPGVKELKADP